MTGIMRMLKLDFFTIKSQIISYLSLVVIILMFECIGSPFFVLCITGAWFVVLISSNIFAIQEKNNMDFLYGSVSIRLNDIIRGRYLFMFLNFFMAFLAIAILSFCFSIYQKDVMDLFDIILGFALSFSVFSIIAGIQVPLFFKMGYMKARGWSLIPFVLVMFLVMIPSFISVLSEFIEFMQLHMKIMIISSILVGCVVQLISYNIAIVFYRKRK